MTHSELTICGRRIVLVNINGSVIIESSNLMQEAYVDNTKIAARWNGMLELVERLVVAHAAEGIDVTARAYTSGIETALESVANNT